MAIAETAEQIAHRFLSDYHSGDTALIDGWKRNADRRWRLTLQLCKSLMEEAAHERVWVCTDQPKLRVFASEDAANRHFASHDPEGVAFACEVEE